ncbi:Bacteriophage protein [Mycobacteroides abscessus subsp. abscessus]|nr:Bacteriophage protein [Mycobacteroides abscessus subsp. abscessus]
MKPADIAWCVLAAAIVGYEFGAPKGELLSEGWDRYLERYPVSARVLPLILTLHVINALPRRFDPVHRASVLLAR